MKQSLMIGFVALHACALFAYTLRWLWVAMLATALLIHSLKTI